MIYLRHSSFSNTSPLILQPSRRFTYVAAHSPTLPSLYLRHSSFTNPSVCFTYVTAHCPTLLSLLLRHRYSLTSLGEPPMVYIITKLLTGRSRASLLKFTGEVDRVPVKHYCRFSGGDESEVLDFLESRLLGFPLPLLPRPRPRPVA